MRLLHFAFLFVALNAFSQELPAVVKPQDTLFTKIDSLYREDQFYFGVTINLLQQKPPGLKQNGLSTGINLGFLRDMPVNKKRTWAIAAGLGLSYNKYHQNMKVTENTGVINYEIVGGETYSRNKLEQLFLDVPIEICWRNSTFESHKFWRIYTGFKFRYLLFNKTKYVGDTEYAITGNNDFNKLQYGPFLSFGYNTWNFHAYYALNPLFKSAKINGQPVDMRTLNLGLMFYIL
ncbi:porin family protein [Flavobacterium sp. 3HN19-14]|uniref:porin family protein n=1 Tax=Flavobacterium sp. 3HN19-14 TaxID=3448133 RepID=UPI003EE2589E